MLKIIKRLEYVNEEFMKIFSNSTTKETTKETNKEASSIHLAQNFMC